MLGGKLYGPDLGTNQAAADLILILPRLVYFVDFYGRANDQDP